MPRKQRFKPSRKPKQLEAAPESTSNESLARDHVTLSAPVPPPQQHGEPALEL